MFCKNIHITINTITINKHGGVVELYVNGIDELA